MSVKDFLNELLSYNPTNRNDYDKIYTLCRRKFKIAPSKSNLLKIYKTYEKKEKHILSFLTKSIGRSGSGVLPITAFTAPFPEFIKDGKIVKQKFSCGQNCAYCPKERGHTFNAKIIDFGKELLFNQRNKLKLVCSTNYDLNEIRVITFINISNITIPIFHHGKSWDDGKFSVYIDLKYLRHIKLGSIITCTKIEQPRSYISTEPGVRRANRNLFDAYLQFNDRANGLQNCGHMIDKIEIIVLGGTWSHYPREYQKQFIRDIYYSANVYYDMVKRNKLSLEDEIKINMNSKCRIIGLTLETRPDCINMSEIMRFRQYGCTRVQLGVQHIDDTILKKINRGCYTKHTIKAIQMLKQNGYKVDIHLMPDLPGSSYELDKKMFDTILGINNIKYHKNMIEYNIISPELQADQWKVYPTEVTRWTKIKQMYDMKEYKPYANDFNSTTGNTLIEDLLLGVKKNVFPWIRLNRIIRDIPNPEIFGGNECTSLRQKLQLKLKKMGHACDCIRCKEVKFREIKDYKLNVRKYNGVDADEYFISYESKDNTILYGFLRLRLNKTNKNICYKSIMNSAMIRELHVYGKMIPHYIKNKKVQNFGFGKKLLLKAEEIAYNNGYNKCAVISGIGVREYYKKNGYTLKNTFMIKNLTKKDIYIDDIILIIYTYFFIIICSFFILL